MTQTAAILNANAAFYGAFAAADIGAMAALWSAALPVSVVHPGMRLISGRDSVLASWQMIFEGSDSCAIDCVSPRIQLYGESGLVLCYEQLGAQQLAASNLFVNENGIWRMVHHQASSAMAHCVGVPAVFPSSIH